MEETNRLEEIAKAASDPNNADLIINVEPEILEVISGVFVDITSSDGALLPNDLGNSLSAFDTILRLSYIDSYLA